MTSVLNSPQIATKLRLVDSEVHRLLSQWREFSVPIEPDRDVRVVKASELPPKKGLASAEGQIRLLHDLANIELQAMELGLRTLYEFPQAPSDFRNQLGEIVIQEGQHLAACLDLLHGMGGQWGQYPVHLGMWKATSVDDDLIDRILIVHRYLEGGGLDAGATLSSRLNGCQNRGLHQLLQKIFNEEIPHVAFGSWWFRELCREQSLDSDAEFARRLENFRWRMPKRLEKLARKERTAAGFSEKEIDYLQSQQNSYLARNLRKN